MGLFPNAQEITESVACLETVREKHLVGFTNADVVAVVVGDGRTPRTAALLAMRTKWRVISIDPALDGLCPLADADCAPASDASRDGATVATAAAAAASAAIVPKELRHAKLQKQEHTPRASATRARMREDVAGIARLTLCALRAQEAAVCLTAAATSAEKEAEETTGTGDAVAVTARYRPPPPATKPMALSPAGHVLIILPHAHVTPDDALRCLRFDDKYVGAMAAAGTTPKISVIQQPCCGFCYHDTALGSQPDHDYLDARIAASARAVRVWEDVSSRFAFRESGYGRGVPKRAADLKMSNARKRGEDVKGHHLVRTSQCTVSSAD